MKTKTFVLSSILALSVLSPAFAYDTPEWKKYYYYDTIVKDS